MPEIEKCLPDWKKATAGAAGSQNSE
jgi:hypothetical protein